MEEEESRVIIYPTVCTTTVEKQEGDILFLFFKDFIYLFLERGEEKEKEKEGSIDVREKH